MPLSNLPTLTKYLIEQGRRYPDASGDFNSMILDISIACKAISQRVSLGGLVQSTPTGTTGVDGEEQTPLDLISNDMLLRQTEWDGFFAGAVSEEMPDPYQIPGGYPRGKYLLLVDPLDGSSNIDVNVTVGTIFSILRAPDDVIATGRDVVATDFLIPGARQMAAGYAIYGPTTMLVLTVGHGVAGFTLDRNLGEFKLTHPDIRVPEETQEFAINTSNSRFWETPVKRYVDECLQGRTGPRGKDFNMRWIASLVAEAHRILMRGGVFLYPRDTKDLRKPGRLRLLYEANAIGMVAEQAGGRASDGRQPILDVQPRDLHQRIGFIFGSKSEVERIEHYHLHPEDTPMPVPLFAERSLFRDR